MKTSKAADQTIPGITLILPAFNEAKSIAATVVEMKQYFEGRHLEFEIIVAADGQDGTREIVAKLAGADARIQGDRPTGTARQGTWNPASR